MQIRSLSGALYCIFRGTNVPMTICILISYMYVLPASKKCRASWPIKFIKGARPTGARGTDHPPFSNFLFTNLFSIKFLYFFIISSLFPYFNLFVSIFIQSYINMKLHVSTLLDTNNTQGMQLGGFKNRTPARFEYIYCTLFPLCHSN